MKKIKYALILTMILPCIVLGQSKKDSKIIIRVADTVGVLNKISLVLYERGYSIQQKDEALRFIATDEKTFKAANASFKYRFFVKDTAIILTGDVTLNMSFTVGGVKAERAFSPIYYGGMKGSALRDAWNEMVALAKQLGTDLAYSK